MQIKINENNFNKLKEALAYKLQKGCEKGVDIVKQATPIDTQRLFETTRNSEAQIEKDCIKCQIIAGGLELYGIIREQDIKKEVDYALDVENRDPYIRPELENISNTIVNELKN